MPVLSSELQTAVVTLIQAHCFPHRLLAGAARTAGHTGGCARVDHGGVRAHNESDGFCPDVCARRVHHGPTPRPGPQVWSGRRHVLKGVVYVWTWLRAMTFRHC